MCYESGHRSRDRHGPDGTRWLCCGCSRHSVYSTACRLTLAAARPSKLVLRRMEQLNEAINLIKRGAAQDADQSLGPEIALQTYKDGLIRLDVASAESRIATNPAAPAAHVLRCPRT